MRYKHYIGKMTMLRMVVFAPLLYGLMFWGSLSTDTFVILGFISGVGLFMGLLIYLEDYRGKQEPRQFIRDVLLRWR